MADDAITGAQLMDLFVCRRMILRLVRCQQCVPAERFNSNEHLKAARSPKQTDKFLLSGDLSVTLDEKGNVNFLLDHLLQQFSSIGVFIEVVGREHHKTNARLLRSPKTFDRRFNRLTADLSA